MKIFLVGNDEILADVVKGAYERLDLAEDDLEDDDVLVSVDLNNQGCVIIEPNAVRQAREAAELKERRNPKSKRTAAKKKVNAKIV